MSLLRTGLRLAIRNGAPPLVLLYIAYKFYVQVKEMPWFTGMVHTYRRVYEKIKNRLNQGKFDETVIEL